MKEYHTLQIETETHKFDSLNQFEEWKRNEEKTTLSYYVRHSSCISNGSNTVWYLYCNRSGKYEARGGGKCILKSQGTNKIGTAHMKVTQNLSSGQILVMYCSAHSIHSIALAHLPVPECVKTSIATKQHQGVTIEQILDVRKS